MIIVITGTPGTGKSTIAKKLSESAGYTLISIRNVTTEKLVDVKKLGTKLREMVKKEKNAMVEGHLACEFRLPADFVFVLRCHPKMLRKRLGKRGYEKEKLEENILAELLDYCTQRAAKSYKSKAIEVDTSKRSVSQCVKAMLEVIKGKRKKIDEVNFEKELREYTGARNAGRKK